MNSKNILCLFLMGLAGQMQNPSALRSICKHREGCSPSSAGAADTGRRSTRARRSTMCTVTQEVGKGQRQDTAPPRPAQHHAHWPQLAVVAGTWSPSDKSRLLHPTSQLYAAEQVVLLYSKLLLFKFLQIFLQLWKGFTIVSMTWCCRKKCVVCRAACFLQTIYPSRLRSEIFQNTNKVKYSGK